MNSKLRKEFEVELFLNHCQTLQAEIISLGYLGFHLSNLETETPFLDLYSSFSGDSILESKKMAECYQIVYCFENDLREIVTDIMNENFGHNWWENKVSASIKGSVTKRRDEEMENIYFKRSDEPLFYTTLGELKRIILDNVEVFEIHFRNEPFIKSMLHSINRLRIVVGHNCLLENLDIQALSQNIGRWYTIK